MRRRVILRKALVAVLAACFAGPALAASTAEPAKPDGQYVDISPVALPIVHERRLVNYVFVAVRLTLTGNANVIALREKEPYFRDALVRLAHRRPFTRLDNFTQIDEAALRTALAPEVNRIAGPRQITGIQILNQTPQRRANLPRPPQAPAPKAPAARAPAH